MVIPAWSQVTAVITIIRQEAEMQNKENTGADQVLGECCAEGVHYVGALRGSVEQVIDGDSTACNHHNVQHC